MSGSPLNQLLALFMQQMDTTGPSSLALEFLVGFGKLCGLLRLFCGVRRQCGGLAPKSFPLKRCLLPGGCLQIQRALFAMCRWKQQCTLCWSARKVNISSLNLLFRPLVDGSSLLLDWLEQFFKLIENLVIDRVLTLLWVIWSCRNQWVFQQARSSLEKTWWLANSIWVAPFLPDVAATFTSQPGRCGYRGFISVPSLKGDQD